MSWADVLFVNMCRDILDNGFSTEGQNVRARWADGTPAHTIKQFGVVTRYDLQDEFPAMTLRPTYISSRIWDEWADENGTIGKAYGYQMSLKYRFPFGEMDQVDAVLWQLKNAPYSRRIITNMYNFNDLAEMGLEPCAYSMTFNVTREEGDGSAGSGRFRLNAILNQRSQDILTANNWNVVQYALLLMMFAQVSDMVPGELVHVISDAHIYDRHADIVREMIRRPQYAAPTVRLNPEIKDFYQFTKDDIIVENYQANPQIRDIPVAI